MNTDSVCPRCGASIPKDAPRGHCPRCLMDGAAAGEPQASSTQAPSVDTLSDVFPQLEVFEALGSGGMGCVYKARQTHLDRIVALKILPPELASDPAFAERFAREARALARLNHPNILQCYDFGQSPPTAEGKRYFYLLLEYVDGVNLRQTMRTGTLTAREALAIVPRLCDALHYAHEQGVLHRDIKPENILIDKKGRVKIADFGLARLSKGAGDKEGMTLTMSGAQLGTAAYMAPEQIEQPHAVDHRADIYSLGVVFYEMLTGELPLGRFAAPSETSGVDPRLDSVVFRTLEKQKERRYQSAEEVQTHVETIAGTPSPNHHAAFSSASPEENPHALKTGPALAFPPSWLTWWNWIWRQPFLFQRGRLTLEPHQLVYQSAQAKLSIPLNAIEAISLVPLAFAQEPLGRCPVSIRWRDAANRLQTTCILPGTGSWLTPLSEEQANTDAWVEAITAAAIGKQDKTPAFVAERPPTCAKVTPPLPLFPHFVWNVACAVAGFIALMAVLSGNPVLGLPLALAVTALGYGLWRRRDTEAKPSEPAPASTSAAPSKSQAVSATLRKGWDQVQDSAGKRIKAMRAKKVSAAPAGGDSTRSRSSRLSRAPFLFTSLSLLLLLAALLTPFTMRYLRSDKFEFDIGIILFFSAAALVFLGCRLFFRMVRVRGLWAWRKDAGATAIFWGALLLTVPTWWPASLSLWEAVSFAWVSGLCFALSGLGSGGLALLLTAGAMIAWHELNLFYTLKVFIL